MRVRCLRGRPERELAVHRVVVRHRAAGLHRSRVHPRVDDVLAADHHVGPGENGVRRSLVAGLPVEAVVVGLALQVGPDHRCIRLQRAADVGDGVQVLVLDVDQLQRVTRGVPVLGDDERDLLALEPHLVGDQHGLDVVAQGRHPGQALLGQHRPGDDQLHLRVRLRRTYVDAEDLRVRHRGTQDRQVQHAVQLDVVAVAAPAADEARVLLAQHPAVTDRLLVVGLEIAEPGCGLGDGHASTSSCSWAWASSRVWRSCTAAHCTLRTIVA